MRLRMLVGAAAAACLGLVTVSQGQSAPPDQPQPLHDTVAQAPVERVTWIGAGVLPVSENVARQLRLPAGVGLSVEDVAPDGPAARGGLQQYDIIQRFDDQVLFNPQQFGALVRMHKAGDMIRLSVIHEGRPVEVKVALGEADLPRPVPVQPAPPPAQPQRQAPPPDRGHDSPADRLRGLKIPKINVRIDGDQLIVEDGKGHQLFRQPLEFDLNDDRLPLSVHVHAHKNDGPPANAPEALPPVEREPSAPSNP